MQGIHSKTSPTGLQQASSREGQGEAGEGGWPVAKSSGGQGSHGFKQESARSGLLSEKTIPGCKSLLFHSISSLLLNHVFYLVTVTLPWKKKKRKNSYKRICFELKEKAAIIEKLIPCCMFICCMKFYSFEKLLSSKCSQITAGVCCRISVVYFVECFFFLS